LQTLHESGEFHLILKERIQRQARLYDYTERIRLHSSMLRHEAGDTAWQALVQTVNRLPLPTLLIERLLPPKTLIESDEPVNHVVGILRRNHAIVRMLNE
jgi:hypothetical protein